MKKNFKNINSNKKSLAYGVAQGMGVFRPRPAKNLTKPNIKVELEKRNDEIKSQKTMDMQEVMERLAAIARGETVEQQVTNKGTVVEVEPKTSDQIRAMELIGKRYGAWTDKKEVTGGLEINVGVGDWDADD